MIDTILFHIFQYFFIYNTFIKMTIFFTGLHCFYHRCYIDPLVYLFLYIFILVFCYQCNLLMQKSC